MKRIGVLSNPRSGTSLLLYLIVTGFDFKGIGPLFKEMDGTDIYQYRITYEDVVRYIGNNYYLLHIVRDPRDVIVSRHPSNRKYIIDYPAWKNNHDKCSSLYCSGNICSVRFEDLLADPASVQQCIEGFTKLQKRCEFVECYRTPPSVEFNRINDLVFEMGGLRKIEANPSSNWSKPENRDRILHQVRCYPGLAQSVIHLGYEVNSNWVDTLV